MRWKSLSCKVVRGHQVASGRAKADRFPGGTIAMQIPFFAGVGLDLSDYFPATINVSIAPMRYEIRQSRYTFEKVKWHPVDPAETFSFFDCEVIEPASGKQVEALIYFPHPETKPDHEQPGDVLEILARREIGGIEYGSALKIRVLENQLSIR